MKSNLLFGTPLSQTITEQYSCLHSGFGLIELTQYKVIELIGEDRESWLQGQITNDIRILKQGDSMKFCICQPAGQIIGIGRLWKLSNSLILIMDKQSVENFLNRCEQSIILEDVKPVLREGLLLSLQGPLSKKCLAESFGFSPAKTGYVEIEGMRVYYFKSIRIGDEGWDLLIENPEKLSLAEWIKPFPKISKEVFSIVCLESGIPEMGVDIQSKTLVPELGPNFERSHISYQKGCYTGQEVLMRIHSRGHTNQTWMALSAEHEVAPDAHLSHSKFTNGGKITRVSWSPKFGFIAGAYLKNEIAKEGETVLVQDSKNRQEARVYNMPLYARLSEAG